MTESEFKSYYPQFAGFTPAFVLSSCIAQANARFSAFTAEDAEEARRLYAAHKLTLYARTALPDEIAATKAQIAAAGQPQRITGKKAGEVSVTYAAGASSASSAASTVLADLPETTFGLQLLSLIRLYSRSVYIP
ncbi:MAG: DUF4054 domain-containing protein [Clostridia bacterium]|nr:DUF4054 domain-containing protein [Clostridia bacterium]MBR0515131.1 DUF4054 domain-containing protein [Clostridia bacterium]